MKPARREETTPNVGSRSPAGLLALLAFVAAGVLGWRLLDRQGLPREPLDADPVAKPEALETAPADLAPAELASTTAADPAAERVEPTRRALGATVDDRFVTELEVLTVDALRGEPLRAALVKAASRTFLEQDEAARVVSGRTDAGGRVVLRVPLGSAFVTAAHTAGATTSVASSPASLESPGRHEMRLELRPGALVQGRVLDAGTGAPVQGARVSEPLVDHVRSGPTLTDPDGRFSLSPWRMGVQSGIGVTAPGYAAEAVRILVKEDGSWHVPARFGATERTGEDAPYVEVELLPERVILGAVTRAGSPLEHAVAQADGSFLVAQGLGQTDQAREETGSDGAFVLRGLRPDVTHTVWVHAGALEPQRFLVEPGHARIDLGRIELAAGASVSGTVVDPNGHVPGVTVSVRTIRSEAHVESHAGSPRAPSVRTPGPTGVGSDAPAGPGADPRSDSESRDGFPRTWLFTQSTTTDENGDFEVEGLPRAELVLEVEIEGRRRGRTTIDLRAVDHLRLSEPISIDEDRHVLTGTVLAGGRDDLGDLWLELDDPVLGRVARTKIDAGGRFRLWGLQQDERYLLKLVRKGETAWIGAVSLADEPLRIEL